MGFQRIDVEKARELIAQNALVVDIRDGHSFANGAMPGAVQVSGDNIESFVADNDKSRPLIVCCYHGNTSQGAAQYFTERGFKHSYSLDGGYEAWDESEAEL
tara:strand:- start:1395 stop:1700 length:306 start_codon:yes stop_codon:yes gene_type:complete